MHAVLFLTQIMCVQCNTINCDFSSSFIHHIDPMLHYSINHQTIRKNHYFVLLNNDHESTSADNNNLHERYT